MEGREPYPGQMDVLYEPIRLPALTVVLTNGQRYSANGIYTTMDENVVFLWRGNLMTFNQKEIDRVEFTPAVYAHCPHCDQTINRPLGVYAGNALRRKE